VTDNVALNPGAGGATLATDEIGGVHYQILKLAFGALDTATLVSASAGMPVSEVKPSVATRTSVAGANADTSLLASNATRKGATVYNDSSVVLYLALGAAAASITDYTVQVQSNGYYEVPSSYTGEIRGIWASATGNARITELT
jgi:hypothetical protein